MIDAQSYQSLTEKFPGLNQLDAKTAEIARDELDSDEVVSAAVAVTISGTPGAVLLTNRRVLGFWTMKLLFFFRFPTLQEFALSQMTAVEQSGAKLRLKAVADPSDEEAGYEDNVFAFADSASAESFAAAIEAARS